MLHGITPHQRANCPSAESHRSAIAFIHAAEAPNKKPDDRLIGFLLWWVMNSSQSLVHQLGLAGSRSNRNRISSTRISN